MKSDSNFLLHFLGKCPPIQVFQCIPGEQAQDEMHSQATCGEFLSIPAH